jgi:hypothetical protein
VASPVAGKYYVKVHAYAANSGVTVKASYTADVGGGGGGLQNGVPMTNQSGASGQELSCTVTVSAGSYFTIARSGGSGDSDLYVKKSSAPTTSSYDCRPYKTGNSESCAFSGASGTYYIKLRGYTAFSGVQLKATWQVVWQVMDDLLFLN